MRVMQLVSDLDFAGAQKVVVDLVQCLVRRDVECAVTALAEGHEGVPKVRAPLAEMGVDVFCAGAGPLNLAWPAVRLRRHLGRWRPEILHCHLLHGHAAGALARLTGVQCRLLWTFHTVHRRPMPVRRAFYRLTAGWPDYKVFVSQAARRYHHASCSRRGAEAVIYNGVDLWPFFGVSAAAGSTFGAVGRLVPEKGYDVLLRAFARLAREEPAARLRMAGVGPMVAELRRIVRAEHLEERVTLVGFASDMPAFLSTINVFVHPPREEGFGLTLLEALAAGLPCIASRVDALPEIGGELVRWVEPNDADGLYEAMREASRTGWSPSRVDRERHLAERFSRDAMAARYLEVYRSLMRSAGAGGAVQ
jgi:glycosyltransferase involved in cell wall biosynthesis